jgi:hypothetical protein
MLLEVRAFDERHGVVDQPVVLPTVDELPDMRVLQLRQDRDLSEKPVCHDGYGQLRMKHFQGDASPLPVVREEDPGSTAPRDLALDDIASFECAADDGEEVAANDPSHMWLAAIVLARGTTGKDAGGRPHSTAPPWRPTPVERH